MRTVRRVQAQGLGVELLLLNQPQGFRKTAVPCGQRHSSERWTCWSSGAAWVAPVDPLTTLAEVLQGFAVALQVLVDGVALVVLLQALQHV